MIIPGIILTWTARKTQAVTHHQQLESAGGYIYIMMHNLNMKNIHSELFCILVLILVIAYCFAFSASIYWIAYVCNNMQTNMQNNCSPSIFCICEKICKNMQINLLDMQKNMPKKNSRSMLCV